VRDFAGYAVPDERFKSCIEPVDLPTSNFGEHFKVDVGKGNYTVELSVGRPDIASEATVVVNGENFYFQETIPAADWQTETRRATANWNGVLTITVGEATCINYVRIWRNAFDDIQGAIFNDLGSSYRVAAYDDATPPNESTSAYVSLLTIVGTNPPTVATVGSQPEHHIYEWGHVRNEDPTEVWPLYHHGFDEQYGHPIHYRGVGLLLAPDVDIDGPSGATVYAQAGGDYLGYKIYRSGCWDLASSC
jgi:hypothetical protein